MNTVIKSGSTPFQSVEIITNSPDGKKEFEAILKHLSLRGTVRLEQ